MHQIHAAQQLLFPHLILFCFEAWYICIFFTLGLNILYLALCTLEMQLWLSRCRPGIRIYPAACDVSGSLLAFARFFHHGSLVSRCKLADRNGVLV